jgi:hypothetical protein
MLGLPNYDFVNLVGRACATCADFFTVVKIIKKVFSYVAT